MSEIKKNRNKISTEADQTASFSSATTAASEAISLILQDTSKEIASLKEGKIPTEVIYAGEAGKKLGAIDHQGTHPYTLLVNNGFLDMFISAGPDFQYSAKKLRECLGRMDTRIDIGTGNGIVSNMVAFPIVSQRASARLDREIKALRNKELDDLPDESHKPHFIACDLSKASLSLAEDLAKDHFHDLEKLFTLEYYQGTFQKLLAENNDEKPRLITMFNVLANFEYDDLKKILQDVADAMKPGDIFIPSFFAMHDMGKSMAFGMPFYHLTRLLYENNETEDRCVSAFCDRYKVDPQNVRYNVDRENDGRDFIDVTLSMPKKITLHVPGNNKKEINLPANECRNTTHSSTPCTTFSVFKSYRMSQKSIKELCESVGFKIDYELYDRESIHFAPVLYKP